MPDPHQPPQTGIMVQSRVKLQPGHDTINKNTVRDG